MDRILFNLGIYQIFLQCPNCSANAVLFDVGMKLNAEGKMELSLLSQDNPEGFHCPSCKECFRIEELKIVISGKTFEKIIPDLLNK
jgi:hypothetical protein